MYLNRRVFVMCASKRESDQGLCCWFIYSNMSYDLVKQTIKALISLHEYAG